MSGMLKSNRSSDATYIGQTDDWNAALEEDIAAILGIPLDSAITSPIFTDGYAYSGNGVKSTGKIAGVLRFLTETADYDLAAGVEFEHGSDKFKISCYNGNLVLFAWDTDHWDIVINLDEGVGSFLALTDTPDEYLAADALKFVRVNATYDGLEFAASGAATTNLEDLADIDPYVGNAGRFLQLTNEPIPTPMWVDVAPGGSGGDFTDLGDVYPSVTLNAAAKEGYNILGVTKDGSTPNYTLKWGAPMFVSLVSSENNYILDDWQNATEIGWTVFEEYGSELNPFLLVDGGPASIPKNRPGLYLIELWWNCTSDGQTIDGIGGLIQVYANAAPLVGYAQKQIFMEQRWLVGPSGGGTQNYSKVDQITTFFLNQPSGATTGSTSIRVTAIKNFGAATVHIDGVRMNIVKVA